SGGKLMVPSTSTRNLPFMESIPKTSMLMLSRGEIFGLACWAEPSAAHPRTNAATSPKRTICLAAISHRSPKSVAVKSPTIHHRQSTHVVDVKPHSHARGQVPAGAQAPGVRPVTAIRHSQARDIAVIESIAPDPPDEVPARPEHLHDAQLNRV